MATKAHISKLAVLRDGKLDRQLAILQRRRFGNKVIPVHFHILENALQIRTKINALCIAENIESADLSAMCAGTQTIVIILRFLVR